MTSCERALALFLAPLVLGILLGAVMAEATLRALERDREKRQQIDDACDHGLTHDISVPPPWLGEDTFMLDGMAARRN